MATHGKKKVDEELILALACGTPLEAAALKARVSERTVYRRMQDPQFRQRIKSTRAEMIERAASLLTAANLQAVKTLLSLQETTVSEAVRLGASKAILEYSIRLRAMVDLEERLAALEQQFANSHAPATNSPA
jgi:hypothetical protein